MLAGGLVERGGRHKGHRAAVAAQAWRKAAAMRRLSLISVHALATQLPGVEPRHIDVLHVAVGIRGRNEIRRHGGKGRDTPIVTDGGARRDPIHFLAPGRRG